MMNLFLTKQQVENMDYDQCQAHMKKLKKAYQFERPLKEYASEISAIIDDLVNTILYIEDQIQRFEDPRITSMNPTPVYQPKPNKPKIKPGRQARAFRIGDKIYENMNDASKQTGIRAQTLRTYAVRNPERYGFIG